MIMQTSNCITLTKLGAGSAIRHRKEAREASARSQRREGWTRRRRSFRRDAPPCPALTTPNPLTCSDWRKKWFFFWRGSGKRHCAESRWDAKRVWGGFWRMKGVNPQLDLMWIITIKDLNCMCACIGIYDFELFLKNLLQVHSFAFSNQLL